MQTRSQSGEELQALARRFVEGLATGTQATLVTLSGELGAGKTTFAQGIALALGVSETVTSPTFVIEKIYELSGQQWDRLIHIDAYRLNTSHELEIIGWQETLADPKNLIVLEWPERVADIIPPGVHAVRFDIDGDARIITTNGEEN
jgi:tRNA threonylcarbamoyl adenosine modification protein YjeE